jgi:hypothetical protein
MDARWRDDRGHYGITGLNDNLLGNDHRRPRMYGVGNFNDYRDGYNGGHRSADDRVHTGNLLFRKYAP